MNKEELEVIGKLEHTLDYGKEVVITDRESHVLLHYIEKMNQSNKTLQSKLYKKENKINAIKEYIYKNSIPIDLLSNPPKHRVDFEGDINEVLKILDEENQ